jgi:hypothetical protein
MTSNAYPGQTGTSRPRIWRVWRINGIPLYTDDPYFEATNDAKLRMEGIASIDRYYASIGDYLEIRRIP